MGIEMQTGKKRSKEFCERCRLNSLKQFKNGMPEETKKKLSESHMGHRPSEETKKKLSESVIMLTLFDNTRLILPFSRLLSTRRNTAIQVNK